MKENTLTAKEWLEQGFAPIKNLIADENGITQQKHFEECMEQYANYRNKELEDKILEYRKIFLKDIEVMGELPFRYESGEQFISQYDKHFNIK